VNWKGDRDRYGELESIWSDRERRNKRETANVRVYVYMHMYVYVYMCMHTINKLSGLNILAKYFIGFIICAVVWGESA